MVVLVGVGWRESAKSTDGERATKNRGYVILGLGKRWGVN